MDWGLGFDFMFCVWGSLYVQVLD